MARRQTDVPTFISVLLLAKSIACVTISPAPVPGVEPELSKAFRGHAVYLSPEEAKNVRRSASPNLYSPSTSNNNWDYDNHVGTYDYFPKYKPSYPGYEHTSGRDKCGGGWPSGGNNWNQGTAGRPPPGSGSNWGSNSGGWNQGSGSNWNSGGGSGWNQGGGPNWNSGGGSGWNQGGGPNWNSGGGSGWNQGGGGSGWNQGGWSQGNGNWGGSGGSGWHKGNQGGWDQGGGGASGWGGWTTGSGGWSKLPSQPGSGGQWNQNSDRKWGTGWSGGSNSLDDCGYKCDNQGVVGFYGKGRRN